MRMCNAVFTYGEKGYYVAGFVVAFAVIMHLAELSRGRESSPRSAAKSVRQTIGSSVRGTISG